MLRVNQSPPVCAWRANSAIVAVLRAELVLAAVPYTIAIVAEHWIPQSVYLICACHDEENKL